MPSSPAVDVLTDLLERSRARGAAFAYSTAWGDWGVAMPKVPGLAVHTVVDGEAHLWTDDPERAMRLLPGDMVLVQGTLEHRMGAARGVDCVPLAEVLENGRVRGSSRRFTMGEGGGAPPAAVFFCGAYMFEGDLCESLLRALPERLRLRPASGSALRATMELLGRELQRDAPGQQTLLDRLLDVALVQALREHFAAEGSAAPAWVRALADPPIGAALGALHADPARTWTVADLAAEANLSRAAFARRFGALLGMAPLAYLTDWRMALARERLRDSDDGLAAVAAALGYASEFSFAAAFKRHHGLAPGRWRTLRPRPQSPVTV